MSYIIEEKNYELERIATIISIRIIELADLEQRYHFYNIRTQFDESSQTYEKFKKDIKNEIKMKEKEISELKKKANNLKIEIKNAKQDLFVRKIVSNKHARKVAQKLYNAFYYVK